MVSLCKHWGHKLPLKQSEQWSEIALLMGNCRLYAGDLLKVELESDTEQMLKMQQVAGGTGLMTTGLDLTRAR
ncbi:DUF2218 domain-containing protein [Herminiimonas sp. NPDC097707]|uniref:DUF2218 domain-containing protein n=1 Tax=Herminiimonas sp. NPDC097707 TaxID=3364007 RepID=UPI00383BB65B